MQRAQKKDGPNQGRKFWACAAGKDRGCAFFIRWQEANYCPSPRPPTQPQRPALPGFAQHLGDWQEKQTLQQVIQCDPKLLGVGRDVRQPGDYDTLELVASWRVPCIA